MPAPGGVVAALADALVMAPFGIAEAILDAVDERGADLLSAVDEFRVAGREPDQRRLIGTQRVGEIGRQMVIDAEALRIGRDLLHADLLG